jgi:GNAT superfamily N-acetyltransferase
MQMLAQQLIRLPHTAGLQVTSVLCESFYDYPVMRYVLGHSVDYDRRLEQLIGLFVAARTMRDDVMLGVSAGEELIAVATTSDPAAPPHPDFAALKDVVWRSLGAAALERYQRCVAAWESMAVAVPQLHVNMIGVRTPQRGTGLARRLLAEVHALSERTAGSRGVSLTTEDPRNVQFYERQGYEVIGNARITDDLQAWSFFRPNG